MDQAEAQLAAPAAVSGGEAVDRAAAEGEMAAAEALPAAPTIVVTSDSGVAEARPVVQSVGSRTFFLRDGVWTDSAFDPDAGEPQVVPFASDAYFELLSARPELGEALALGEEVIVVVDGAAYRITGEGSATDESGADATGQAVVQTELTPVPPVVEPTAASATGVSAFGAQLCASALILPLVVLFGWSAARRRGGARN
jgi:Ca-activated chloride channel family protein